MSDVIEQPGEEWWANLDPAVHKAIVEKTRAALSDSRPDISLEDADREIDELLAEGPRPGLSR